MQPPAILLSLLGAVAEMPPQQPPALPAPTLRSALCCNAQLCAKEGDAVPSMGRAGGGLRKLLSLP